MTSEKILQDFIVFVLLDQAQLNSGLPYFFDPENSPEEIEEHHNYFSFITQEVNVKKIYNEQIPVLTENNSLEEFISKIDTKRLIFYINNNFTKGYGYDMNELGEEIGGHEPLNLNRDDLLSYCKEYFLLHEINPDMSISFLLQIFKNNSIEIYVHGVTEQIDRKWNYCKILPVGLSHEYIEFIKKKLKTNLFIKLESKPFQFYGFFDSHGLYLDIFFTLSKWAEIPKFYNISYEVWSEPEVGLEFLKYQYFLLKFYNETINFEISNGSPDLIKKFNTLKNQKLTLINYLKNKGFDEVEINFIFNILANNEFDMLNIRKIKFSKTEFFRFCYLFYIFDYFNQIENIQFKEEGDFQNLFIFNGNKDYSTNQLKKNYQSLKDKNSKHYPFLTLQKTLDKLKSTLEIPVEKLKPIPSPSKYEF